MMTTLMGRIYDPATGELFTPQMVIVKILPPQMSLTASGYLFDSPSGTFYDALGDIFTQIPGGAFIRPDGYIEDPRTGMIYNASGGFMWQGTPLRPDRTALLPGPLPEQRKRSGVRQRIVSKRSARRAAVDIRPYGRIYDPPGTGSLSSGIDSKTFLDRTLDAKSIGEIASGSWYFQNHWALDVYRKDGTPGEIRYGGDIRPELKSKQPQLYGEFPIAGTGIDYSTYDATGIRDDTGDHWTLLDPKDPLLNDPGMIMYLMGCDPSLLLRPFIRLPASLAGACPIPPEKWEYWLGHTLYNPPLVRLAAPGYVLNNCRALDAYEYNYIWALDGNASSTHPYPYQMGKDAATGILWISPPGYLWLPYTSGGEQCTPVPGVAGGVAAGDFIAWLQTGGRGDTLVRQLPQLVASGQLTSVMAALDKARHAGSMFSKPLVIIGLAMSAISLFSAVLGPALAGVMATEGMAGAAGLGGAEAALGTVEIGGTLAEAVSSASLNASEAALGAAEAGLSAGDIEAAYAGALSLATTPSSLEAVMLAFDVSLETMAPEQTFFSMLSDFVDVIKEIKHVLDPISWLPEDLQGPVGFAKSVTDFSRDLADFISSQDKAGTPISLAQWNSLPPPSQRAVSLELLAMGAKVPGPVLTPPPPPDHSVILPRPPANASWVWDPTSGKWVIQHGAIPVTAVTPRPEQFLTPEPAGGPPAPGMVWDAYSGAWAFVDTLGEGGTGAGGGGGGSIADTAYNPVTEQWETVYRTQAEPSSAPVILGILALLAGMAKKG